MTGSIKRNINTLRTMKEPRGGTEGDSISYANRRSYLYGYSSPYCTVPAIVISQECNTGNNTLFQVLAVISITATVAGVAAFYFVLLVLVLGKRKPQTQLDDDYV